MRVALFLVVLAGLFSLSFHLNKPSFNGTSPGCSGGGCHNLQTTILTTAMIGNNQVEVSLHGVPQGNAVGGELVDATGSVVDVIDETSSNPFILTAPAEGPYRVNAGFKSNDGLVWDSTEVNMTISHLSDEPGSAPRSFELSQNHPNPFNAQTVIRFYVAQAGQVRLDIFNISGERVRALTKGYFQEGHYRFNWNGKDDKGTDAPTGVYIYRLTTGQTSLAQRMILSK